MARFPRRGKGSDKTTDGKISNSVSASDGKSGRADDKYVPAAPKPPVPPKAGRSDLNAGQGSQRQREMYPSTTPQMSPRERAKLDAMNKPDPYSPAPRGMGMGSASAPEPAFEQPEAVRLTREEIDRYAMQSVRDFDAGREPADLTHLDPLDFRAIEDAVPSAQDRHDQLKAEWQSVAQEFTVSDMNRMTAEGEQGANITSHDMMWRKEGKWLIGVHASGDKQKEAWHDFSGVFDAVAAKPESKEQMEGTFQGEDRYAVFIRTTDGRQQFADSEPSRREAEQDWVHFRGLLAANGEQAIGELLVVSNLTPLERAIEQVELREQPKGTRHERMFTEITGKEFSSLSNPPVEAPYVLTSDEHKSVAVAFDQAPALTIDQVDRVRDLVPEEGRATTVEGVTEQFQWHSNKMFEEGRDLKDIYASTGMKPEDAEETAWEKTEYVYGQPTALDRLQDVGRGGFAVSESGYTYALSADGKELVRFDPDLKEAGRKPVEDVQAFLQEKRGVEFDQKQEEESLQAKNNRLEAALTEGKRPDDMPEAEWEQEQQAWKAYNESEAAADRQWEFDVAVYERQQEYASDPSVWTPEGYEAAKAEVLASPVFAAYAQELQEREQSQSVDDERKLVYASNNADEIAAFEDRVYENSPEQLEHEAAADAADYAQDVEHGVELSGYAEDRTIVDDLRTNEGASVEYRGYTYELNDDIVKGSNEEGHSYTASADALQEGMKQGQADLNTGKAAEVSSQAQPEADVAKDVGTPVEVTPEASPEIAPALTTELPSKALDEGNDKTITEAKSVELTEVQSDQAPQLDGEVVDKSQSDQNDKTDDAKLAVAEHEVKDLKQSVDPAMTTQEGGHKDQSETISQKADETAVGQPQDSGASLEMSQEKSKPLEEDKIHDVDHKLGVQSPQQEPSTLDRFLDERKVKEAQTSAPSAEVDKSVQVDTTPGMGETTKSSELSTFDTFAAQQDAKAAEQKPELSQQQSSSVSDKPTVEQSPEPTQQPSQFETFAAEQNKKEATSVSSTSQEEEERRRSPDLEPV